MKTQSALLPFVALIACVSCSKPEVDLTRVSVGMTKEEVIAKLGKPTRVSVQGRVEFFEYEAYDKRAVFGAGYVKENFRFLFIRFIDGRVESFGKKGDFDSTKNPTTESKIDLKIDGSSAPTTNKPSFDLASELKKLEDLKKNGLITDAEYQQLRQHAIDKAKAN